MLYFSHYVSRLPSIVQLVKLGFQSLVFADKLGEALNERVYSVSLNVLVMQPGHSKYESKLAEEVCLLSIVS